jgi:hypothetical protein
MGDVKVNSQVEHAIQNQLYLDTGMFISLSSIWLVMVNRTQFDQPLHGSVTRLFGGSIVMVLVSIVILPCLFSKFKLSETRQTRESAVGDHREETTQLWSFCPLVSRTWYLQLSISRAW